MEDYKYDLFFSFASHEEDKAKKIYEDLASFGFKVFYSNQTLKDEPGKRWSDEITDALKNSKHFIILCTISSLKSEWVIEEYNTFHDYYHMPNQESRKMYIIKDGNLTMDDMPVKLRKFQFVNSLNDVCKNVLSIKTIEFLHSYKSLNEKYYELEAKFKIVQKNYLYYKFWSTIFDENKEINIITCARDMKSENTSRGCGARTNIDKWDYSSVLELTHFITLKFPQVKLRIEEPVSKINNIELNDTGLHDIRDEIINKLRNRNCIIIGSPNVSDYAEIVLSKLHKLEPYKENSEKTQGYLMIKKTENGNVSFYTKYESAFTNHEGVKKLGKETQFYKNELLDDAGKMYGILTIANNPFVDLEFKNRRKLLILSGFSGISTYAIAKFLTDEKHIEQFSRFDTFYNHSENVEVLITCKYRNGNNNINRDTRYINHEESDTIIFEDLIVI